MAKVVVPKGLPPVSQNIFINFKIPYEQIIKRANVTAGAYVMYVVPTGKMLLIQSASLTSGGTGGGFAVIDGFGVEALLFNQGLAGTIISSSNSYPFFVECPQNTNISVTAVGANISAFATFQGFLISDTDWNRYRKII